MAELEARDRSLDRFQEMVDGGLAEWVSGDDGRSYLRLRANGRLFEIVGEELKRVE